MLFFVILLPVKITNVMMMKIIEVSTPLIQVLIYNQNLPPALLFTALAYRRL